MTRLRKLSGSRQSVLGKKKADLVAAGRNQSYRADTPFMRTRSRWVVVIAVFCTGWSTVVAGKYFQGSSNEVAADFCPEIWYDDMTLPTMIDISKLYCFHWSCQGKVPLNLFQNQENYVMNLINIEIKNLAIKRIWNWVPVKSVGSVGRAYMEYLLESIKIMIFPLKFSIHFKVSKQYS